MGLGPSIKMTTLHHFNCPVTNELRAQKDIDFCGIIVDGVSEVCEDKIFTAKRAADIAVAMRADGAIVAIDGWGNHHVDFVNVIEQLGLRGIPSVGLSFVGLQGRLVCTNKYVDCVVDFNKGESGYENCVVGFNNLTQYDAYKAVALLRSKMKKAGKEILSTDACEGRELKRLLFKKYRLQALHFGDETKIERGVMTIDRSITEKFEGMENRISKIRLSIVDPKAQDLFVNSNLDFAPIACKERGELGEGVTRILDNVVLMLTGVEEGGGFQPSNIGSSEGMLHERVVFDQNGTPKSSDFVLHLDVLFKEGEGRTAEGIMAAHRIEDLILYEIRAHLQKIKDMPYEREEYKDIAREGKRKIILVKIVSGLGNMYDTSMFPNEPGGFIGSHNMMASKNIPYVISPNQCKDGVIHSLL